MSDCLSNEAIQIALSELVEWTIKDGIPFHAPTLAKEVRQIVASARRNKGN